MSYKHELKNDLQPFSTIMEFMRRTSAGIMSKTLLRPRYS